MNSLEFNNLNKKRLEIRPEDLTLESLDMSVRTYQALKNIGIKNLKDIIDHESNFFTIENIPGFNKKSGEEVFYIVKEKGLKLKN